MPDTFRENLPMQMASSASFACIASRSASEYTATVLMPISRHARAQVGAVAILSVEANRGKTAYFGAIDKCKFKQKVVPGDRLRLECEIIPAPGENAR